MFLCHVNPTYLSGTTQFIANPETPVFLFNCSAISNLTESWFPYLRRNFLAQRTFLLLLGGLHKLCNIKERGGVTDFFCIFYEVFTVLHCKRGGVQNFRKWRYVIYEQALILSDKNQNTWNIIIFIEILF